MVSTVVYGSSVRAPYCVCLCLVLLPHLLYCCADRWCCLLRLTAIDRCISCAITNICLLFRPQTTLLPALAPAWAKQQYQVGAKSVKVDSLEYFPNYLDHLKADMENEKHVAVTSFIPAAFVTFK